MAADAVHTQARNRPRAAFSATTGRPARHYDNKSPRITHHDSRSREVVALTASCTDAAAHYGGAVCAEWHEANGRGAKIRIEN